MSRVTLLLVSMVSLTLLLTACIPKQLPEATIIPTQRVWLISYPPELAYLKDEFSFCLDNTWNTGFVVEEYQDQDIQNTPADVMLTWGDVDPLEMKAYQIGSDRIQVVVNSELLINSLSVSELKAIYNGEITEWSEIDENLSGEIHGWIYPDNLKIRQIFETSMGGFDHLSSKLSIAPDVSSMIEAISGDTQSIGFIPVNWRTEGLQSLQITDWTEDDIPIVAMTKNETDTKLNSWISCLMDDLKDHD